MSQALLKNRWNPRRGETPFDPDGDRVGGVADVHDVSWRTRLHVAGSEARGRRDWCRRALALRVRMYNYNRVEASCSHEYERLAPPSE